MIVKENVKIRRTFRRITCWKIVEWDNKHCEWTGPFYKTDSYVEGKILESDKNISVFGCNVTHGLHTYADESDARIKLRHYNRSFYGEHRLVKCRIPIFSQYIEGTGEDGTRCYVSEKLRVVKFV